MSLTRPEKFECPYCMTYNDIEIDEDNDINQQQIVDCQISVYAMTTQTLWLWASLSALILLIACRVIKVPTL